MIKIAGIILFSGGIAMLGCHKAFGIKEDIKIRKALFELVIYIKSCIEESSTELSEIYSSYNSDILKKTGFLDYLKEKTADGFENALEASCLNLPSELLEIYKNLAKDLGKSRSGKLECEKLSRYIKELERAEEKLIKEDEVRLVLYKKLGVLTGLLAALILI